MKSVAPGTDTEKAALEFSGTAFADLHHYLSG